MVHLATRRVEIAGTTPHPDGILVAQIAKNPIDGFLTDMRFLIRDNDGKFSGGFDGILQDEGIDIVRTPYRAPNANAYAKRFVRTIKYECVNRMIFFGVASLRRAQSEFLAHYNRERNHQGIGNRIIDPGAEVGAASGHIACRERLRGMLRYYRRAAGAIELGPLLDDAWGKGPGGERPLRPEDVTREAVGGRTPCRSSHLR